MRAISQRCDISWHVPVDMASLSCIEILCYEEMWKILRLSV